MTKFLQSNKILILVFTLIITLCLSMAIITVSQSMASADAAWVEEGTIAIGHLTDTHYYPFRFCYTGDTVSSDSDDFFYNYVMKTPTKMWLEAEMMFDTSLQSFANNPPDYIVLSGDIAQDGELISQVDVANKLRALQNYVRAEQGNDKFQIFVVFGNHDLYNPDTFRFDGVDGKKAVDLYTDRVDATKIYAGLGYPNMTETEAAAYFQGMSADLPAGYTYVRSNLSSEFSYTWEFLKPDGEETRKYDMSVLDADDVTFDKMISANIVNTIDNRGYFASSGMSYRYERTENVNKDTYDIDLGQMTFIARRHDQKFTFIGMDVVLSSAVDGHVLGGQLQNSTQQWLLDNQDFARPKSDTLIAGSTHHSVLPHWSMEEEVTTGFIVYNWQEVSDFLADYGMRYIYTGHMHANDTVSKVSFNGNQITDLESAANHSIESQIKITRIKYGSYGEYYAEKAMLSAYPNKKVKAVDLFDKVYANDKYGYVKINKLSEFLIHSEKSISDFSKYAKRRIYDNTVENYLKIFLNPNITEKLGDMIKDVSFGVGILTVDLGEYVDDVVQLADNLLEQISLVILKDYHYKGETELFKQDKYKIFGFLEELVSRAVYTEIAENTDILTVFMGCYMNHCSGHDVATYEDLPSSFRAVLAEVKNGNFVDFLFELLLDRDIGLMKIIEGLNNTTLDISKGISSDFKGLIKDIGAIIGFKKGETFELDLAEFNLGKILAIAGKNGLVKSALANMPMEINLEEMSLPEIIDDIVFKYVTSSFTQAIGEYAYNICVGFGVDGGHIDVHDDNGGKGTLITVKKGEQFTYTSKAREEEITVENGKLPDMLTTNFGVDPSKQQHFTYLTDRRVKDGAIEYVKVKADGTYDKAAASTKAAKTELYGTNKTLIDLGIWCQTGYVEMSRHTIELSSLEPATTYAYRVGSSTKGYWSDWYKFTTGPASDKAAFSALITSDLQSSTETAYQRIDTIYRDILKSEYFSEGISFLINTGDATDNSRNMSQFRWFINSSPDIYASYSTVISAGNHDEKHFSLEKSSNVDYYGGVSDDAIVDEYNFLQFHYNYELTAAQNQLTGFYFSFDYSGVHFSIINTNDIENDKLSNIQFQWLKADLEAAKDKRKVVVMHKSLYSEGSHSYDKEVVGMREQLSPLFEEQNVNLVIAGHDHTYTETFYLDGKGHKVLTDANGKNVIGDKGTMYLTMGTMGEKFYRRVENPLIKVNTGWSLHSDDTKLADPVFGKLVFDGENLSYYGYQYLRTYNEDGSLKGGTIVEIKKSLDYSALVGIGLAGITVVAILIAVVVTATKKRKQ